MKHESLNPVAKALANAQAVRSLQANEGWLWLMKEIQGDMEKLTRRVMEEDISIEERERLIVQYRALKAALERPASVLEGALRVMAEQPAILEENQAQKL
jgi:hypothetical protein